MASFDFIACFAVARSSFSFLPRQIGRIRREGPTWIVWIPWDRACSRQSRTTLGSGNGSSLSGPPDTYASSRSRTAKTESQYQRKTTLACCRQQIPSDRTSPSPARGIFYPCDEIATARDLSVGELESHLNKGVRGCFAELHGLSEQVTAGAVFWVKGHQTFWPNSLSPSPN